MFALNHAGLPALARALLTLHGWSARARAKPRCHTLGWRSGCEGILDG